MISKEESGNIFIDEFEIKGNKFYFKEMSDWSLYRSRYIDAWQSAFQRNEMHESLEWMLGTHLNKTYLIEDSKEYLSKKEAAANFIKKVKESKKKYNERLTEKNKDST